MYLPDDIKNLIMRYDYNIFHLRWTDNFSQRNHAKPTKPTKLKIPEGFYTFEFLEFCVMKRAHRELIETLLESTTTIVSTEQREYLYIICLNMCLCNCLSNTQDDNMLKILSLLKNQIDIHSPDLDFCMSNALHTENNMKVMWALTERNI
jgi:hypothetical protein